MPRVTARDFCNSYLGHLKQGEWSHYSQPPWENWTRHATDAAANACERFNFQVQREYFRLDVMGWEPKQEGVHHDWFLRVAFEHENHPRRWPDELCKLSHIVADLKVLVLYPDEQTDVGALIQGSVDLVSDRIRRATGCEWLFIVGPVSRGAERAFEAFVMSCEDCVVKPLPVQSWRLCELHGYPMTSKIR